MLLPSTLVTALAVVLAAPAPADTPPSTTVITACVSRLDKFPRIVASPSKCAREFESIVQWNAPGPAGAAGPQGAAGPMGLPGPASTQGCG